MRHTEIYACGEGVTVALKSMLPSMKQESPALAKENVKRKNVIPWSHLCQNIPSPYSL
ncbi:hypothetical protein CPK_ORF00361 [Chlamydia pneumoniae LPCoLN]|uniref:Uncharacterized protein n=1 Tax=Chlamydia pneumoniae TaxID=83558 RepID=A0A0F7X228_CHLPN|nr:hypothetical protein CPK_ORF00361 [Chlamydia pneumoniae LPCoLN]CRI33482.1 Uncharacterized protein BN1224_Wien1_A_09890 [Chlamydia pneumoniae]CRI36345.1 Uncharacterized protein BN1224_CM1_A_09920 [Chlamydia pneumoniae]CRI37471.1 Uncharacterized protein BN1224_CV14_A_09900 [Chlamydia pneumoniae]CRI38603.1 Uncharacterized protein BN1224_CV15_C_04360 [Chlamydia pneumoniae]